MVKRQNNRPCPVRKAREQNGWTQLELAKRVGCSESQITKLETGRIPHPAQWLRDAVTRELGVAAWEVGV